jgi:hypothetical protein
MNKIENGQIVEMTTLEIQQLEQLQVLAKNASDAQQINNVRDMRNHLLAATDWTQVADNQLPAAKKQEFAVYRQALRDFMETSFDAYNPAFPTKPE